MCPISIPSTSFCLQLNIVKISKMYIVKFLIFKLTPTFDICVVAGQIVTLLFDFSAHWLLTFSFCNHCTLPKIQQPFGSSLSCYDHIYGVTSFFIFHSNYSVRKHQDLHDLQFQNYKKRNLYLPIL